MGQLLNIVTPLHTATKRDFLGRMQDDKIACMQVAREYRKDFWDGDRRYGYGGYRYDGRWTPVAERLIEQYDLQRNASILDVGCGKGYLLYELK
ncbi:MAG: SAM-dependent methyltransferase, partial [Deltaproteobacteria bacterium]|nr:SAM-dependent methyltransferase [Deltaproteobacteria bacterium]